MAVVINFGVQVIWRHRFDQLLWGAAITDYAPAVQLPTKTLFWYLEGPTVGPLRYNACL